MARAAANLRAHVQRLAGEIGERNVFRPEALASARHFIASELAQYGYSVRLQRYDVGAVPCANLEATRPGRLRPEQILVLGAHYDSIIDSPGANDNGSGVASLLEIARRFATASPGITVRFVAFANEEPPFFAGAGQGSMVYAASARAAGEDIRLMISLETIGYYCDAPGSQTYPAPLGLLYPDRGNFLGFVSDLRSAPMMRRCARAFRRISTFPLVCAALPRGIPGVGLSDHASFWHHGYRAFMITDTAFYRYPYYHTAEDTPEKVDYSGLAVVTDALAKTFAAIAQPDLHQRTVPPDAQDGI